jgi:adenine-specific DNA-methyltransferase
MNKTKELGQYFTTNINLKDILYNFIFNKPECILEPSIGQGDLITYILEKNPDINFDMYEIDNTIKFLNGIDKNKINFGNFLNQNINKLYKTIIGNPPYIKQKFRNIYIDFIDKCFNLLEENGELIFIVPSDFLKLTSASKILNKMMLNGSFTHIHHPNNEKLFENASINIIIFRYVKDKNLNKTVLYNDKLLYITNSDGLITFNENETENTYMFGDYFDIYVGIVSGKEDVFKNDILGNIEVLNGFNKKEKYILIDKYPSDNPDIDNYLIKYKSTLLNRKIRKFNEKNWFEWGALRNIKTINENIDKECIYLYNLTRKNNIAFKDKVSYFGGNLICLIPKKNINLDKILLYLNSIEFKNNFMFSGRFKCGHRQLYNSFIPNLFLNLHTTSD